MSRVVIPRACRLKIASSSWPRADGAWARSSARNSTSALGAPRSTPGQQCTIADRTNPRGIPRTSRRRYRAHATTSPPDHLRGPSGGDGVAIRSSRHRHAGLATRLAPALGTPGPAVGQVRPPLLRQRAGVAEHVEAVVAVGGEYVLLAGGVVPDLHAPEVVAAFVDERADLVQAVLAVREDPEPGRVVRQVDQLFVGVDRDLVDGQRPEAGGVRRILRLRYGEGVDLADRTRLALLTGDVGAEQPYVAPTVEHRPDRVVGGRRTRGW